jgi:hypothetical protein
MPHVVSKMSVAGSVGDLAKITELLEERGVNILAIGGGEGIFDDHEVGVIAMVLDPDEDSEQLKTALEELVLDDATQRRATDVEMLDHVHVLVQDKIGALGEVAAKLAGINIRSVISMGTTLKTAHVSLGFKTIDTPNAKALLSEIDGLVIVPHEEEDGPPA